MSSMRKAAAVLQSLPRTQHGSKWCLAFVGAWLPNCFRKRKVEIPLFVAQTPEERSGMGSSSLCSAPRRAVLPYPTILKGVCGMAPGRLKARLVCLGSPPALLEPGCPCQAGVEPDSSSMTPQSLTLWDARLPPGAPACSAIPPVQSRGIIHISDKRIGY